MSAADPGNGGTAAISRERLSDLIGAIYDCAVRPELWPETIDAIGAVTNCFAGMIAVIDLDRAFPAALFHSGYEPGCLEWMMGHGGEMVKLIGSLPDLEAIHDEPVSVRRILPAEVLDASIYARESVDFYGITDSISLILFADRRRVAMLGLSRHQSRGPVTDGDLAAMRMLAPHIRRSVTISDLLDMKTIEGEVLASALDRFAVGVVIVGDDGRILHSNEPARRMLAKGSPIQSSGGRIATLQAKTTVELRQAIAIARANEAEIGKLGIGVPLVDHSNWTGTAHILPLARGAQRGRLIPQATAAVFVMPVDAPRPVDLELVARIFSLTPAEGRLLNLLAAGADLGEAAEKLGISEATAKTHRTHLFAKMGVKRRADLLATIAGLVPPVSNVSSTADVDV